MGRGHNSRNRGSIKSKRKTKPEPKKQTRLVTRTARRKKLREGLEKRITRDKAPNDTKRTVYINLATTVGLLFEPGSNNILNYMRDEMLRIGAISDFVVLAPGKWAKEKIRQHLKDMLERNGHGWAWNHVVFPLPTETSRVFISRVLNAYEVTHYVDTNREFLACAALDNDLRKMRIFFADVKNDKFSWSLILDWIRQTMPNFYRVIGEGMWADEIIHTGYKLTEAPNEE